MYFFTLMAIANLLLKNVLILFPSIVQLPISPEA